MHILYLSRDFTPHDLRFLTAIAAEGYTVSYLRLENQRAANLPELPAGVKAIDWAGGKKRLRWWYGPRYLASLKRVVERLEPDLIHAGPIQSAGLLAVLSKFQPVIVMSWAYDIWIDAKKSIFSQWATRKAIQGSARMLADCEVVAEQVAAYGYPKEKIDVFPWGIDLAAFSPAQKLHRSSMGWTDAHFVVFHNRAYEKLYGIDVIVQGFIAAAQTQPELVLLMAGSGSLEGEVQQQLAAAGLKGRVKFLGLIKQSELSGYYQMADLYVSASHSDGSSVSLMEALGCGVPVLLSDIPGNREWISEQNVGWLFEDGNPSELADCLVKAVVMKDKLPALGLNARRLAEQKADWQKNKHILMDAYKKVLGKDE